MSEDWCIASIGRIDRAARDLHEALGRAMDALREARSRRLAGVGEVDIAKGLVARGGRALRLAPTVAFREFEPTALRAYTGLRWGEMAALRVRHVDPLRRRMHIARSVTEDNGRLIFDTTKTGEERTVPLPKFLAEQVAEAAAEKGPDDLVFESTRGGVLRNGNFNRRTFARAAKAIGEPQLTPHGLYDIRPRRWPSRPGPTARSFSRCSGTPQRA